ncbi:ORF6N domain-containing protein [uncultured Gemella sp.]|uniref:ORF6N domain-containing protein n=1 Tax=uncultured Gemella sp. TaxID=254352 RepID=UPI0028D8C953|nr:ORF6N domain-containing protein [uncultured Gemella sp.]
MKNNTDIIISDSIEIKNMIYNIRGKQVMLDSDLASLYQVETKVFNQAVKRNIKRFPELFRFQLTEKEFNNLRSQSVTSSSNTHGGRRYMPYVFTEQGIAMLSAVLKSDIAIEMSIKIINSFVEMRNLLMFSQELYSRLDRVELKQLETDKKLEEVFTYIARNKEVKQKIFFNGQIYDAFSFLVSIIQKANREIILIDNYIDIYTLNILCKKNSNVKVKIYTAGKGNLTTKDIEKFNEQYTNLTVKTNKNFHDRFLILDSNEVYHIGASIKDAGKKSFGVTKIEENCFKENLLSKIE